MFNAVSRIVGTLLAALVAFTFAACGQKGPLFVPGVPADAPWPYPKPTPPAEPAPKKTPDVPARDAPNTDNK
jgi:predicted small lipoprotein YifL